MWRSESSHEPCQGLVASQPWARRFWPGSLALPSALRSRAGFHVWDEESAPHLPPSGTPTFPAPRLVPDFGLRHLESPWVIGTYVYSVSALSGHEALKEGDRPRRPCAWCLSPAQGRGFLTLDGAGVTPPGLALGTDSHSLASALPDGLSHHRGSEST